MGMKSRKLRKEAKIAIVVALLVAGGGVSVKAIQSSIEEKKIEAIEKQEEEAEKARIAELKSNFPSVSENGLDDAYDAMEIWERLRTYDYSPLNDEKVVFLTFDDGPSSTNTPVILETLKKHDVKATFFVTGSTLDSGGETAEKLLKQSYEYGNSIANHSYSHDYKTLYPGRTLDLSAFLADFNKTEELMKDVLGEEFKTNVWRCPGGYMSWKGMDSLKEYSEKNGIAPIDWNALCKDAEGKKKNASELYQEAINTSKDKDMIVLLMHDTYGKEETAKYLDDMIQYYKDNGYVFKTLA